MDVKLLSKPDNALKIIYTACRTCYSSEYPINIWQAETSYEKMLNLVKKVIDSGHHSTIEHCQFTFSISGISRACTHQLVRHRHMSFCQKSQRYVTEKKQFEYITPKTVNPNKAYFNKSLDCDINYNDLMAIIHSQYCAMIDDNIPAEDARFILPNGATSSMIASLNLRELIHLANLRLCTNAQWEIRELIQKMCDIVSEQEEWLKDYLVPKCVKNGRCDEIKGCGRI